MKILLLGKQGQVGTELQRTLLPLGEVIALGRAEYDLKDLSGLNHVLETIQPEMIVNAAAYTAVDKAENDTETAQLINATLPLILADYAYKTRGLLVHYSTDYVFDGEKQAPYVETDTVNPQSVYARSKRAGEEAILNSGCRHLIFRTSWVFSVTGKNFIKTILQLARERDSLRVVADQYGAPTSAELIADITALAISHDQQRSVGASSLEDGIYHLTSSGCTTWYDLACYVVDKALQQEVPLQLTRDAIQPISSEDYPLPAVRPKNSRLDTTALSRGLRLRLPEWTVYVDRTMNQLMQCKEGV